jgi:hypothetical protein
MGVAGIVGGTAAAVMGESGFMVFGCLMLSGWAREIRAVPPISYARRSVFTSRHLAKGAHNLGPAPKG